MSPQHRDHGFTMIELLVTISLMGVMMAITVSGYTSWSRASGQSGTAQELQSVMSQTQQRAVTEGRAMCLLFDLPANEYTVYRGACDVATKIPVLGPLQSDSPDVRFASPLAAEGASCATIGVTFHARGTATACSLRVTRTNSTKVYLLKVEGLTGRASLS
jgi:prepilin-type N-terminal cleavage/methylation domain-containing protein